ncbi:MAG: sulfate ABC transporter substrate-binding protein [Phycisphaerales bacterium]|nr:MAG: sulfate ABC transporter substrate-binding protein [Phycisphaerales bacterium]
MRRMIAILSVFTGTLAASMLIGPGLDAKAVAETFEQDRRPARITMLNVSYDPTRELYRAFNAEFAKYWREKTGQQVTIRMSHGGSGGQARAVIDGLAGDVVTLALAADIDAIAERAQLLPKDWQGTLPHNNAPYTSTLAFLVRKGNPKNIKTWSDLARDDVSVITPNPKTSGVARWNYLAMWGYALQQELGADFVSKLNDPEHASEVAAAQRKAQDFVAKIYGNVPVLDTAARGATNTFIQRRMGDVLINWENEILLGSRELDEAGLEMVVPPVSILAEPVVAVVTETAKRNGTTEVATAYLEFLYSDIGQDLAGRFYYRPVSEKAQQKYREQFPDVKLFTINDVFGGWESANRIHFRDGGTFDEIYKP